MTIAVDLGRKPTKQTKTNKSQEVNPLRAGDHKAAMNRRESMPNTRHDKHLNDSAEGRTKA